MSESIFQAQTKTQSSIYFWCGSWEIQHIYPAQISGAKKKVSQKYARFWEDIEPTSAVHEFVLDYRYLVLFRNYHFEVQILAKFRNF